jgi:DNA polymerase III alpha subunit
VKFKLKEYSLYVDGSIEVDPSIVTSMLLKGVPVEKIFVTEINSEIEKFNQFSSIKIGKKGEIKDISFEWTIPDHYKYMNIDEYLLNLSSLIEQDNLFEKRLIRLAKEIELFKRMKLEDVLRVIIFITDEFKKKNIVWGVGRGSSCSSYILFLIGLHDIDSVLFDIDIEDFLRV